MLFTKINHLFTKLITLALHFVNIISNSKLGIDIKHFFARARYPDNKEPNLLLMPAFEFISYNISYFFSKVVKIIKNNNSGCLQTHKNFVFIIFTRKLL